MNTLLTLQNISYKIGDKTILSAVDLTLYEQEIVTIVGPNGAGKTSLLAIILGLIPATGGKVIRHTIHGKILRLAYVPQIMNRDSTLPINVMEFLRLSRQRPAKAQVEQLLDELALSAFKYTLISDLSGGEVRRILFARALLNRPQLLVLDEPMAGVDVAGQERFYQRLNQFRKRYQFAVLMVSHDLHLVMSASDRVICLNQHICCQGKPAQVINNPHYRNLFKQESENDEQLAELAFYRHSHNSHGHDTH